MVLPESFLSQQDDKDAVSRSTLPTRYYCYVYAHIMVAHSPGICRLLEKYNNHVDIASHLRKYQALISGSPSVWYGECTFDLRWAALCRAMEQYRCSYQLRILISRLWNTKNNCHDRLSMHGAKSFCNNSLFEFQFPCILEARLAAQ